MNINTFYKDKYDILRTIQATPEYINDIIGFSNFEDDEGEEIDVRPIILDVKNYGTYTDQRQGGYSDKLKEDHWGAGYTHKDAKQYSDDEVLFVSFLCDQKKLGMIHEVLVYYKASEILWWTIYED